MLFRINILHSLQYYVRTLYCIRINVCFFFQYLSELALARDSGQTAAAEPEPRELHKCVSFLRQSTRFLQTLPATQCAVSALSAAISPGEERSGSRRRADSRASPAVPPSGQLVHIIYELFLDARSCLPSIGALNQRISCTVLMFALLGFIHFVRI